MTCDAAEARLRRPRAARRSTDRAGRPVDGRPTHSGPAPRSPLTGCRPVGIAHGFRIITDRVITDRANPPRPRLFQTRLHLLRATRAEAARRVFEDVIRAQVLGAVRSIWSAGGRNTTPFE